MTDDARPVILAFDGSDASHEAARAAASLFHGRVVLVVSVWEPGLAMVTMSTPDTTGISYTPPTPEQIEAVDRAQHDHAAAAAHAGAALVRKLGGTAEALPVAEGLSVAETVIAIAEERDAAALVVGSRGLGAVRSRLLGSTSRKILHDTLRPVLVVRVTE